MRLGIFGGTFDPIHFGHLRIAEEVCEECNLEKVLMIPGSLPPHKNFKNITPFHDRLSMTHLAVQSSPFLEVLDLEGRRAGPSYSIETIREIRGLYDAELQLFFIIGTDAFQEIRTWKEYKNLFDETHFIVIKRPGFSFETVKPFVLALNVGFKEGKSPNTFENPSGHTLAYKEGTLMEISSTRIREMVADGKSIRFLVPESVRTYISEKGIYRIHEHA